MSKAFLNFFKRNHWNKTDAFWFIALIVLALWIFYPTINDYINPIIYEKYITSTPHE